MKQIMLVLNSLNGNTIYRRHVNHVHVKDIQAIVYKSRIFVRRLTSNDQFTYIEAKTFTIEEDIEDGVHSG